jgi:hypothetical protein
MNMKIKGQFNPEIFILGSFIEIIQIIFFRVMSYQ